jgi:rhodanese-related sulfurtransferase
VSGSEERAGIQDVDVREVWRRLKEEPDAVLVDVRTRAEWAYVGLPDLTSLGKQPVLVEWQSFPGGQKNPSFVEQLRAELAALYAGPDTSVFFICRSGVRSLHAAQAMAAVGYRRCHNVADGFEGPHDATRHRGTVGGWKVAGLPWVQG